MRYAVILAAIAITCALSACSTHEDTAAIERYELVHDGLTREYFVFRPSTYDGTKKVPVTLFLHGYGGTATGVEAEVTQGLNRYAERAGFIVVYPQSSWFIAAADTVDAFELTSWNHISDGFDRGPYGPICLPDAKQYECPPECGECGECGWASCNDDVGFLKRVVADVLEKQAADKDRIYVAGFSNGAMMAQRVACEASDLFAAVFLAGGRVEPGFECTPGKPLPLLQINGARDRVVPYDGSASDDGYLFSDTLTVTEQWLDGASCHAEEAAWTAPSIAGSTAQCSVVCADTPAPVVDCLWPEGDHRWPGTAGPIGSNGYCVTELQSSSMPDRALCIEPDSAADIWGSALMFEFFAAQPR